MASRRQVGLRLKSSRTDFLGVTRGISCVEMLYLLKCKIIKNPKVSCQMVYLCLFMLSLGRRFVTQVEIKTVPLNSLVMSIVIVIIQVIILNIF